MYTSLKAAAGISAEEARKIVSVRSLSSCMGGVVVAARRRDCAHGPRPWLGGVPWRSDRPRVRVHQAALDSAGFTNRFATDKARQGMMVPLPRPSLIRGFAAPARLLPVMSCGCPPGER